MANAQVLSGITKAIIQGNLLAIKLAKSCITTPVLINTDIEQGSKYAIPLQCETNQKSAAAEVSESLVICTDAKKNVTDNVAPGSKSWHLTGYIQGAPGVEVTNYFTPMLRYNVKTLWSWFERGAVLMFKDGDSNVYDRVVIKDLQTSQQKDSANAVPFSMTLKEINLIPVSPVEADTSQSQDQLSKSQPDAGSEGGAPEVKGSTNAESVEVTN
jgi:hypothetical protein